MNKERPMLFSTPMVRAVHDNTKDVTRRIIKTNGNQEMIALMMKLECGIDVEETKQELIQVHFPYGDIIWMRETWCRSEQDPKCFIYKADMGFTPKWFKKWKPSIHMPKEACRQKLKIKNVTVERLQDITEEQAEREGYPRPRHFDPQEYYPSPTEWYVELWDKINKKSGLDWDFNPWVWVIEFEKVVIP